MKKLFIFFVIIMFYSPCVLSQGDEEDLYYLIEDATKLIKKDKYKEAMELLKEAYAIDSKNIVVNYAMAYIHFEKKEYQKTINILEKFTTHQYRDDVVFKLLGNAYNKSGNTEKALEIYNLGMLEYPFSGTLYHGIGDLALAKGDVKAAMVQFEFGIRFDPKFPLNYYDASKILLKEENIWGLIYGEMFLYLEDFDNKFDEISALMFNYYKNRLQSNESIAPVSIEFPLDSNREFEKKYLLTDQSCNQILSESAISIKTISDYRRAYLQKWYETGGITGFPNAMFDLQKLLYDEGLMEVNSYLLFSHGDEATYKKYYKKNESKIERLSEFYKKYLVGLTSKNAVYRGMYK